MLRAGIGLYGTASLGVVLLASSPARAQVANTEVPESVASAAGGLQEVVVTAQRRSESVQDVPYNISAIDAATILQSGAVSINDLTRVVPGLTSVDEGAGARGRTNNLTLRGLRTDSPGGGQATTETPGQTVNSVSTYWGETPVFFPMPLYDIDHVEVLRGPQGTLYGSGAEAGTIRFIPTRPKFDRVSGEVQVDAGPIERAADIGNWNRSARGFLNLPIAEKFAVRLVASVQHDGGFINNNNLVVRHGAGQYAVPDPGIPGDLTSGPTIGRAQYNTNYSNQWFTRMVARWNPSDWFDLQVDYLHQYIHAANTQYSSPGFGGGPLDFTSPNAALPPGPGNPVAFPHSTFVTNPGGTYTSAAFVESPYSDVTNLVSSTASVDLGFATVTSASSYYTDNSIGVSDWTGLIDNPATVNYTNFFPYNNFPRIVTPAYVPASEHAFVQEIRLVSKAGHFFDYVLGGYYNRQPASAGWLQLMPGIAAFNSYIGQPNPSKFGDLIWNYDRKTTFQDRAVFGELTMHPTSAWQVTGGVRYFGQSFRTDTTSALVFCGSICASDLTNPEGLTRIGGSSSVHRHIWKLNTSYDFSRDSKVYLTYSEGFRRGGANAVTTAGIYASLPKYLTFAPDLAKNYEVGFKGYLLKRKLRYSADIYRVNLDNFQFNGVNLSGLPVTYNGATARSQGAELELQFAIAPRTQLSVGYAYTDAKVTRSFELFDYPSYSLVPSLGGTGQVAPLFGGPIPSNTRLPGVPRNTVSFGIDQTVSAPLLSGATLTLHLDGAYRSAEGANIVASSPYNWTIPSSFMANARATLDTDGALSYSLYVENLTNDVGYSGGTNVQAYPYYGRFRFVSRPRTWGMNVRYSF